MHVQGQTFGVAHEERRIAPWAVLGYALDVRCEGACCGTFPTSLQVYKFKFDLQPGSLTDQVAGEHQPSYKHP